MTESRLLCWVLFVGFSVGCTPARSAPPNTTPQPVTPVPEPLPTVNPSTGPWTFKYAAGHLSYQIGRTAVVERLDSLGQREITTNTTHELLVVDSAEEGIGFTIVVDTFATTTQGLIGVIQPTQLPVQVSGLFANNAMTINGQTGSDRCSPISTVLITDLHNLLVPFPPILSSGVAWTDTVDIQGCQSGVATLSHTTRSYIVSGESSYEGQSVIVVVRADTTYAEGEGGLQQHRVSTVGNASGTATYYLNQATGEVVHIAVSQTLDLRVTTVARQYRFRQDSKQDFRIVP
jgi:hypothetical protein